MKKKHKLRRNNSSNNKTWEFILGQVITIIIAIIGWYFTNKNTNSQIQNSLNLQAAQEIINARPYLTTGIGTYKEDGIVANSLEKINLKKLSGKKLSYIENTSSNPITDLTVTLSYVDDTEIEYLSYNYFKIENLRPGQRIYLLNGIPSASLVKEINAQFSTKNGETIKVFYDFKDEDKSIPMVNTELNVLPKKSITYYDDSANIRNLKKLSGNKVEIKDRKLLKDSDLNDNIENPPDDKHIYFEDYLFN
ncbi:hypothetical protein EAI26_00650 [Lactobacillus sp. 0.1XD8-4]|uniref:hypothetical protein n=1 Tax=Lactobacillaceae TaxID=33958 RepID=UPI00129DABBF|nr:hypothetical protein [Lactobacillus intestinalis]MRN05918.1 hypothetical protein [Lactobacillus sp. 0.1XD8-4]